MSATAPDFLIERRGVHRALDAFVVGTVFSRDGTAAAFALGDGTVRLVAPAAPEEWRSVEVHDGAVLALAAHGTAGFATGGDDGKLCCVDATGAVSEVAGFGSKWVEQVASHTGDAKSGGLLACAVGRGVHLFDGRGEKLKVLDHPSSVTGIAFDAKGKRIAASHYNGASVWFVASKSDNARKLEWKGSHIGVVMSPDGDVVVTSMQENALHGWRLSDNQHMRMSGYPQKAQSLSFSRGGKWLASSGAESVVMWPFFGGGPMGKAPTELAGGDGYHCTSVACHPQQETVAAGFSDGLVVLADIPSARILPVAPPGRGSVSALAWSPDGTTLAIGSEDGFAAVVDFARK